MEDKKAQAGVGTLIIFISMVLVAAVAASVLIQTSGSLQQKASQTGQQAIKEVSNKLKVMSVVGYSQDSSTSQIDKLIITVKPASGSRDIRIEDITMNYQATDYYLSGIYYNSSASDSNGKRDFYSNTLDGNSNGIIEQGEMVEFHFWIEDTSSNPLSTDTEFTMEIMVEDGASTRIKNRVPSLIRYSYTTIQ